jgi:hypothetical protein
MGMSLWKVSQIAKENFALGAASRDAEVARLHRIIESRQAELASVMRANSNKFDTIQKLNEYVRVLRDLIPKRTSGGFVSFGKYYAEQEDKFNDPHHSMCKFKRKYLSDCEEALTLTGLKA